MTDKVVVITGGSRGIGRATALAAAARGYRVVVGYASNQAAANEVVAAIEASNGKAIKDAPFYEIADLGAAAQFPQPVLAEFPAKGSQGHFQPAKRHPELMQTFHRPRLS